MNYADSSPHDATLSHVLCVVDPNPGVCNSLTVLLEDLARIQSFDSGESFLREFSPTLQLPSLLITESCLPGISGLTLYEKLNSQDFRVPTIILATHNNVQEAVVAIRAGVHDYFEKPFNAFMVRCSVESALQNTTS
ncbi:MAG: response regulator [Gammaproteobacteria bacterium]|nr:response regulator [Gammaproteobacteria bacterium]